MSSPGDALHRLFAGAGRGADRRPRPPPAGAITRPPPVQREGLSCRARRHLLDVARSAESLGRRPRHLRPLDHMRGNAIRNRCSRPRPHQVADHCAPYRPSKAVEGGQLGRGRTIAAAAASAHLGGQGSPKSRRPSGSRPRSSSRAARRSAARRNFVYLIEAAGPTRAGAAVGTQRRRQWTREAAFLTTSPGPASRPARWSRRNSISRSGI